MLLRVLLITGLIVLILLGIRRIWRDWSGQFKRVEAEDKAAIRERDQADRQRGGVIDLKRDRDGTYRPGDE